MRIQSKETEKKVTVDANGVKHVEIPEMTMKVKAIALVISLVIPALNYLLQVFLTKLSM